MGLEEFQSERNQGYRRYGSHEYDEKLEKWMGDFQDRFPVELEIEFIEVSPKLEKYHAKAYRRDGNIYFIRVSKYFIQDASDYEIRLTLLHEMVHVYFYQMGYPKTNHDKYFRWVAGRVMSDMTNMHISDRKWRKCIQPFIEMEDSWD